MAGGEICGWMAELEKAAVPSRLIHPERTPTASARRTERKYGFLDCVFMVFITRFQCMLGKDLYAYSNIQKIYIIYEYD